MQSFKLGHRLQIELSSNELMGDEHSNLLPPDSFHLPSGRTTCHEIFRDAQHRSYLLLPVIPAAASA